MSENTRTTHTIAYRHNETLKWLRWSVKTTHTGTHFDSALVDDITLATLGYVTSVPYARGIRLKEDFTVIPVKRTVTVEIEL